MKESTDAESKKSYDVRNEEAGLSVICTLIKNLKRRGGSKDFMADLDLLSLTPVVIYAVKNNSRRGFFDLRDSVFEVVSEKVKEFFKNHVKHIAASLDNVTVHHVSYTIIITYFFNGQLHIILNKLEKLGLEDYDSEGTARMVIVILTSTLGYTKTQLASNLKIVFCATAATLSQIVPPPQNQIRSDLVK